MTALKYDDVIKKSRELGTILVFLKNLIYYDTQVKFIVRIYLVQDSWRGPRKAI